MIQRDFVQPIEVKAEENLRSRSLRTLVSDHPGMIGWRFSMSGYREQDWIINIPLYLTESWINRQKEGRTF
ncbi:MAG: hypothetical protein J6A79_19030 [Clostridia bacterium]|nr:hypothetical protein [Clostridia bacterium]